MINRLRAWWQRRSDGDVASATEAISKQAGDDHVARAATSLRGLLDDPSIPPEVRDSLASDYRDVEAMLDKLEHGDLHLAVFGRVSVGKSALLNALIGFDAFEVGVLHGTTTQQQRLKWEVVADSGVHLIDTPGINELSGEDREKLAHEVASRADLVLFVCDGDLTQTEIDALRLLSDTRRPLVLALNKADRYGDADRHALLAQLREHSAGLVQPENVVAVMAQPRPETVVLVDPDRGEREERRERAADVEALRARLFAILDSEGKTLAALNAALFAGRLADSVGERITALRRELAERVIRNYCIAKGVAVALNPVPVADLLAAAGLDVALVTHLSRIYGLPLSRAEAGKLLSTIAAQLVALMGAIWGVHLVFSALKAGTGGLSTVATAGAQGALAWYATLLVGRTAEDYLAAGKSWGEQGPKRVVRDIVESLDRNSILREARDEILARLRRDSVGDRG
ncbi:MAG: GTP-binding protein [Xanthomonadales bacterium]|nr:GTP-binding protein [Xanthomonadales bacterium]